MTLNKATNGKYAKFFKNMHTEVNETKHFAKTSENILRCKG